MKNNNAFNIWNGKEKSEIKKILASKDEHIIRCSECGRNLIVKDIVNNAMAFLSHLKNDHGITYTSQHMTDVKSE
jgi:hypothetical protein